MAAVVVAELGALTDTRTGAAASHANPAKGLLAVARASVELGRAHPNRSGVLFERRSLLDWPQRHQAMTAAAPLMAATSTAMTGLVQTCRDIGRSTYATHR